MNKNPTTQTLCSSREIQEELFLGPGYMIGKIPYTQKVQFKLNKTQYLKIFYGLSKQNFVLIYFGFTPAQVTRYPGEKIKKKYQRYKRPFSAPPTIWLMSPADSGKHGLALWQHTIWRALVKTAVEINLSKS